MSDLPIVKLPLKKQQTIVDFTTQNAGAVDDLFAMAALNGIGITDEPAAGTILQCPQDNLKVIAFYTNSIYDITNKDNPALMHGGIGYMQIGTSFKVS